MVFLRILARTAHRHASTRLLHQSSTRHAVTNLQMPAMSPTMTEGGIASWKKKDGESFSPGDVLLEIETDKATIDVEAQDDGVMGKIIIPDGSKNVPVGKVIALLAEEGDDISNLQPPKESPAPPKPEQRSSSTPPPPPSSSSSPVPAQPTKPAASSTSSASQSHSVSPQAHFRPLFPSVHRLLAEHGISEPEKIKGTGVRGMLTKGDVLAFLGKASGPNGTYKPGLTPIQEGNNGIGKKEEVKSLDGPAIRKLIVSTMLQASIKARNPRPASTAAGFDDIIADYIPSAPKAQSKSTPTPVPTTTRVSGDFLDGLI